MTRNPVRQKNVLRDEQQYACQKAIGPDSLGFGPYKRDASHMDGNDLPRRTGNVPSTATGANFQPALGAPFAQFTS
jgi:hypothetical protein